MQKLIVFALVAACGPAFAQTPASNPMPDGSRDMYIGLGLVTSAVYEGSEQRRIRALPVIQAAFSNGLFIAGASAGIHLSNNPAVEFGPLLAVHPRRSESGLSGDIGKLNGGVQLPPGVQAWPQGSGHRLRGMEVQRLSLQAGGFFNYYATPQLRLTNTLMYGSGNERDGALWRVGLQYLSGELATNHFFSAAAGVTVANRSHVQAYFGVSKPESQRSPNPEFSANGGLKDIHLNARWNWAINPSWLVTTGAQLSRLRGSAADSPLTERPTNLTVSTALAYRF